MFSDRSWRWTVVITALVVAVLMQVPQILYQMSPLSQGVLVRLNSDEHYYMARVEQVLIGKGDQAAEAFVGDPALHGTQSADFEWIVGTLFRPFGLSAPWALQIFDSFIGVGWFLVLLWLFWLLGFDRRSSYVAFLAFFIIEFYNLNRPIHLGFSFLSAFLVIALVLEGLRGRWVLGLLGAVVMGLELDAYLWTWNYLWIVWASLVLVELILFFLERRSHEVTAENGNEEVRVLKKLALFGGIGIVGMIPGIWHLHALSTLPYYAEAYFRSGIHHTHVPESIPYSLVWTLMGIGVLIDFCLHWRERRGATAAVAVALAGCIAMNQQIIHGVVFDFPSHELLAFVVSAITALLLLWRFRTRWLLLAGLGAALYLAALAWDGRWVINDFLVRPYYFDEQHFATLLPVLEAMPETTILSDETSSLFIAAQSKHDVVYSAYLKNVVMSNQEIALRHCLTLEPLPPEDRHVEKLPWLIYPDADAAHRDDPRVRQNELAMMASACQQSDRNPAAMLKKFHVSYVLWDQKRRPLWDLKRLQVPLTNVQSGSGWSLWRVGES